MVMNIEPKVDVMGFGPEKEGITPDEIVYGAAKITYKDTGALNEILELKKEGKNIREEMIRGIINSAGAGHASLSTSEGFWCFLEGTCSKAVDSIFTTAKFGSSLMPSGRRVPITKEAVVIPPSIVKKGNDAVRIYLNASLSNIDVYEKLQERGVPKQEASKIVQYGHKGGGFMFMPLETLIHFSKLAENDPDAMPQEGKEIISQLEDFIHEHGMEVVYEARKAAPRAGCPHPNIFHFRKNWAQEIIENDPSELLGSSIKGTNNKPSNERDKRIKAYLEKRDSIFKYPEDIEENWKEHLEKLENIVSDFNDTVSVTTFTNTPWRVWGEVKRHRTMPQTAESVYNAVDRAINYIKENPDLKENSFKLPLNSFVSIPPSVEKDKDNLKMWEGAFKNSLRVYEKLVSTNIKKSDAILVIPRGLKFGVVKNYDLYNLTTGYMSLRLCGTAEPEMQRITRKEVELISETPSLDLVKELISPKCHYIGFCPEKGFKRSCKKINNIVGFNYDEGFHEFINNNRAAQILSKIR